LRWQNFLTGGRWHIYPIGSMYGIYANIGGILMVNVTICSILGSYGYWYNKTGMFQEVCDKNRNLGIGTNMENGPCRSMLYYIIKIYKMVGFHSRLLVYQRGSEWLRK
jgi:hypothetical protein